LRIERMTGRSAIPLAYLSLETIRMPSLNTGRVVRADAKVVHVEVDGRTIQCVPRGRLFEERTSQKHPIAVGDRVMVDVASDPAGLDQVLPRTNWLGRLASSHDPREQVLFANVDHLFAVASVKKPPFSSNRADRILAACAWHRIPATLVINKIDLATDEELAALASTYTHAGVGLLLTSAQSGAGVEELREALRGRVSALYGGSGVGKSSLLNALEPDLALRVGKISRYWNAGKHTTSFSELLTLSFGAAVIDTPGIRVFRLHGATPQDLRGLFPEFTSRRGQCHYPDCTHVSEPDCAVLRALVAGEIAETRYASYLEMMNEAKPLPDVSESAGEELDDSE
jgi:ribosome biogenesis GTPase